MYAGEGKRLLPFFMEASMELRILGMNGPFPSAGGACSGYLLQTGEQRFLLDVGAGTLGRLFNYCDPADITAIFQSHLHHDHAGDLGVLSYYLAASGAEPLPVYAPEKSAILENPVFHWHQEMTASFGEVQLSAMKVRHPVPAYAFKITHRSKTFVFTGDTNTVEGLAQFAQGADLLLADACLPHDKWSENAPHLSALLVGQLAKEAQAGQLLLTHWNPMYPKEPLLKEARQGFANACWAKENQVYVI